MTAEVKSSSKASLVSIDILRAVAALGVFYYHLHLGALIARVPALSWFGYTDAFGALYAVPLFFLISGYCIHLSNIKWLKANRRLPLGDYLKRRFLRIYPPYLIALLLSIFVDYIVNPKFIMDTEDIWSHVFLLQGFSVAYFNSINVVLWTISVEFAFYLFYPFFYFLRHRYGLNRAMIFAAMVSACSIAILTVRGNLSLPQRYCALNIWFAWCCGAYLADKITLGQLRELSRPLYLIAYGAILLGFICFKIFPLAGFIIVEYQLDILVWTAPLVFLISREGWLEGKHYFIKKIMAAIGLSSYSLYLLHEPLIALKNFLAHKYLPPALQPAGVFTGILIIPAIAWFGYRYIEKPFMVKKRSSPLNG